MTTTKILIVEDDQTLNNQLAHLLKKAGYDVEQSFDGEQGLSVAIKQQHQLILLDVMLPKLDGFSFLSILRKTSRTPVIVLTAKGAEEERIKGFTQGADDYLAKPFNTTELLLRIEALLRRTHQPNEIKKNKHIKIDGLFLDAIKKHAEVHNVTLSLTTIQFNLLWELSLHHTEVLSKAYLSQRVLNKTLGAYDRSLDMHLSRIRRKLNDVNWQGDRLQTAHGKGYCLI
ncbi:response regulator transcription factor [Colwellia sp. UCD-KL20]|uniref:response regulator transcription factor n=1 Tax=Colwellia sp. UCD-KL20 TaxID=1917165 RepID=UPI0009706BD4|nr:response regulator transcription factor [Colwellia sp. UCD-KL20]